MSGKISHIDEVPLEPVDMEGVKDTFIQWLITKDDGAPNFAMRRFVVKAGGYSPLHEHPYEHEVFVLSGQGEVQIEEDSGSLRAGSFVLVPPGVKHQFRNTGNEDLVFLCIIPNV